MCSHAHREDIERFYLACRPLSWIAQVVELTEDQVKTHVQALELDRKRADNTENLLAHAVNSAFDRGVLDTFDADQALRALQHIEKRQGKIREPRFDRPQVIIMNGIPDFGLLSGLQDKETANELIVAKVVELPSGDEEGNVPVLDADADADADAVDSPPESSD